MADEEVSEEAGPVEGTEYVPAGPVRPKPDIYSFLLIVTFAAFLAGCIIAGREAWLHYDVQFWLFSKQ